MRPVSDGRLWALALAASLGIHAVLGATLLLLPAPQGAEPGETTVGIQNVPSGLSESVMAARRLEPAEAGKKTVDPVREGEVSEPAQTEKKTLSAADARAQAQAASPDPALAATVADSRAVAAVSEERAALDATRSERIEFQSSEVGRAVAAAASPAAEARVVERQATSAAPASSVDRVQPTAPSASAQQAETIKVPRVAASREPLEAAATGASEAVSPAVPGGKSASIASAADGAVAAARVSPPAAAVPAGERHIFPNPDPAPLEIGAAAAGASETLVPALPDSRQVAASRPAASPQTVAPTQAGSGTAPVAAPRASAGGVVAASPLAQSPAVSGESETVAVLAPKAPVPAVPTVREIEPHAQLLDYLALHEAGNCFLALASAEESRPLSVDGFSTAAQEVRELGDALVDLIDVPVEARAHVVTQDQCGALSFARRFGSYPVPALEIRPDRRTIDSGDLLSGRIVNLERRMLYLLLVDDEGKVEEIHDLIQSAGTIGFEAPMTLKHGPIGTAQILVALASDVPLKTVTSHDGEHAEAYFQALAGEIARTGRPVDLGFTYFFVR